MNETLSSRINSSLRSRDQKTALVAGELHVSGSDLLERSLDLAALLRSRGVRAGDTVAVIVDRSILSIVTILAILNLECAYLPLDGTLPARWLESLIKLASARLLAVMDKDEAVASALAPVVPLGMIAVSECSQTPQMHNGPVACSNHQITPVYVMGTSGTTGKPKAVPVNSRNILHYCDSFVARVGGEDMFDDMRMASVTTLAADLGNTMVFPSLLFGGELHLISQAVSRDPRRFASYIQAHEIDALKVVPTHLRSLLDGCPNVLPRRLLVVGGESFGLDLLAQLETLAPKCAVFNHYGPTEATVGVAMYRVATAPGTAEMLRVMGCRSVPIGTALGDNILSVVDEQLNSCPQGQTGELLISGSSVVDGYLGSPVEPSHGFIKTRHNPSVITYRTGDLARFSSTGEIEILGRIDRQLKVRGHRIEPDAIEEVLRSHPDVVDAIVDCREQGELGLTVIAWVHARQDIDEIAVRSFLADCLPNTMVPSRIVMMSGLPRTANGKIDKTALPLSRPSLQFEESGSMEDTVAGVFAKVLGLSTIAVHDNFFQLGGHSLAVLQVIYRLRQDYGLQVSVESFYADASPAGVARVARPVTLFKSSQVIDPPVPRVSPQVHALWTHIQLNPLDNAYEIPILLRIMGPVTPKQVRQAMETFVMRHVALRTRLKSHDGQPVVIVDGDAKKTLSLSEGMVVADMPIGTLDIENGPLVRGTIALIEENEILLNLLVHHICFDGSSSEVLVHELAAILAGELLPPILDISIEPLEHAGRSPSALGSALGDGARARFGLPATTFADFSPVDCQEITLPEHLWPRIIQCAVALKTTPFVIVTAAWALVLSLQDNERAVTVGTPVNLRDPDNHPLVGYHTNVVVIEVEVGADGSVRDHIAHTHSAVARSIDDRHRPYASLVAAQRALTGTPPSRTLLTIEHLEKRNLDGIQINQVRSERARPIFDVDICIVLSGQTVKLEVHHRTQACPQDRARCLGDQLSHVLEQFVVDTEANIADVTILPTAWRDRVIEWSHGPQPAASTGPDKRGFLEYVSSGPEVEALVWPGGKWSRSRLSEEVSSAAQTLRSRGVGPGRAVAVCIPPSPALVVAWHAVHEVGAAVLALDPIWPKNRIEEAITLAQGDVRLTSNDGLALDVEGFANSDTPFPPELAYLILTSGSTGVPKLVGVQHSALANELSWTFEEFGINQSDRVLVHTSPGFDVAVWEMLGPLARGARLVFPALHRRTDFPHLAMLVYEQEVTMINVAPSLLEALLDQFTLPPPRLRLLVSGGEELSASLTLKVNSLLPQTTLVNVYGPSETAIDATFHVVKGVVPAGERVPLGRPIAGVCTYVLDDQLRLLPPGAFGQLAIAGKAVGLGYVRDPVATAHRFVSNPFASPSQEIMYLTGDRARWNHNGVLEFGGRQDCQVKVRGNRVELEEVEAALRNLPLVQDAAVHLQYPGTPRARLTAFIVPDERDNLSVHDLHNSCTRLLPPYMTPSIFCLVKSLPRLSNGKLARDALPLDAIDAPAAAGDWRTEMEESVARIWAEVLGNAGLDRDLPFFASGGTSLMVPVLQLRLSQALGTTLSVPELFEHTTIGAQAKLLQAKVSGVPTTSSSAYRRGQDRRQAYASWKRRNV